MSRYERTARQAAEQLRRGAPVLDKARHHRGMRLLLAERLGPCPEDYTLSLLDPLSPHAYIGVHHRGDRWGGKSDYVLSTSPDDYTWESREANTARGFPTDDDDIIRELLARERGAA